MGNVARVTEISAMSANELRGRDQSRDREGRPRPFASVTSAWIKEQRVEVRDGAITGYQVNMLVTFILDD